MNIKQRIIETSAKLFTKHGVRTITMNDIAAETGVSKKTLYEYFVNKDELLERCIDFMSEQEKLERESILKDGKFNIEKMLEIVRKTVLQIDDINLNFITDIKKYYPVIWKNKLQKIDEETINFKACLLEEGIKHGFFRSDINVDISSKLLHEQIKLLMNNEIFPSSSYSRAEVFETIMEIFGKGIIKEKFQDELNKIGEKKSKTL